MHRPASPWRAPLVPLALALTAGIVLDRFHPVPLLVCGLWALAALVAWRFTLHSPRTGLPVVYLSLVVAAIGAAWHHRQVHLVAVDDVSRLATDDPTPVRVRGRVDEGPRRYLAPKQDDPMRSRPREVSS